MKNRTKLPRYHAQSIRFDERTYERIAREAKRKGLSFSDVVRLAVLDVLGIPESDTTVKPESQAK